MEKNKKSRLSFCLFIIGVVLIIISVVQCVYAYFVVKSIDVDCIETVKKIENHLPEYQEGYRGISENSIMPSVEIDGTDFIGLIEVPGYDIKLPICSEWNTETVASCPCRYTGSVYNDTLIIGGADKEDQFGFADEIDVGNAVSVTDMTGQTCSYEVIKVNHVKNISKEKLRSEEDDLTLFVKRSYSSEYIIVRCAINI